MLFYLYSSIIVSGLVALIQIKKATKKASSWQRLKPWLIGILIIAGIVLQIIIGGTKPKEISKIPAELIPYPIYPKINAKQISKSDSYIEPLLTLVPGNDSLPPVQRVDEKTLMANFRLFILNDATIRNVNSYASVIKIKDNIYSYLKTKDNEKVIEVQSDDVIKNPLHRCYTLKLTETSKIDSAIIILNFSYQIPFKSNKHKFRKIFMVCKDVVYDIPNSIRDSLKIKLNLL